MTTATRTLDLFCAALGPGAGLEKVFPCNMSKKYANHAKKKRKNIFLSKEILQGPEIIVSALAWRGLLLVS